MGASNFSQSNCSALYVVEQVQIDTDEDIVDFPEGVKEALKTDLKKEFGKEYDFEILIDSPSSISQHYPEVAHDEILLGEVKLTSNINNYVSLVGGVDEDVEVNFKVIFIIEVGYYEDYKLDCKILMSVEGLYAEHTTISELIDDLKEYGEDAGITGITNTIGLSNYIHEEKSTILQRVEKVYKKNAVTT